MTTFDPVIGVQSAMRPLESRNAIDKYKAQERLRDTSYDVEDVVEVSSEARLRFAIAVSKTDDAQSEASIDT